MRIAKFKTWLFNCKKINFVIGCFKKVNRRKYMSLNRRKRESITFPISVFETADTKEDLEDWLLSQNPQFIRKMRKARQEDLLGKGKSWVSLKKELCKE